MTDNCNVCDLTNQNGGLPTSLMVNSPPNHNSLKDYSLQQNNNVDNRRLSISCTESIKQRRNNKRAGGGSTLTYLSDEVRHLLLTAASPVEPKCENLPDV